MPQGFYDRSLGKWKRFVAAVVSAGAADAGRIVALDGTGALDLSVMPSGIGPNQVVVTASEALSAGQFVNLFLNSSVFSAQKADNTNGREAQGYVTAPVALGAPATVKRLGTTNSNLTGLTPGADYWLGTAGGVIAVPLDATNVANAGKLDQYLGRAKSATELVTVEQGSVAL